MSDLSAIFHPLTRRWFEGHFEGPTPPQLDGWRAIDGGGHVLVAAPTGSGKTLTAFLVCIDRLVRAAVDDRLDDGVHVVYVSPLKALSNDIRRNLETPLAEIGAALADSAPDAPAITARVRTGDTPASERQAMLRRPPHILVTTPESLFLLLTAEKSAKLLRTVRTVIVDEIHVLAGDKRGSHLALSLERLGEVAGGPLQRIGLSATQRPIEDVARFLVGTQCVDDESGDPRCTIVDVGHQRDLDVAIEVPSSELSAVCPHETWAEVYARLSELIEEHRSTLVFVNTRKMAEQICVHLAAKLGDGQVTSHHGSLSRAIRLDAEERLKRGELKAIVATASLELGIDVGYIDLVCQIGSPRAIATFLQRVGRAGHSLGLTPKGRLFPLTRDELLESIALIRAVNEGELDRIVLPLAPLDILAQQIVAHVARGAIDEDALFALCRRAWPFRDLAREDFDAVVHMLSDERRNGKRFGLYLHRDRIHKRLRPRRNARISALGSGGAIPENADYRVVTVEEGTYVGTVNEDFALESMAGDIFVLGTTSWQIDHVRGGEVAVHDAKGAPATIPFWLGEAPGRTVELSAAVSRLRADIARDLEETGRSGGDGIGRSLRELAQAGALDDWAAEQANRYVEVEVAALGCVPTQERVVFERFFDDTGGMQLVIHAPFGSRILRAWGLALRKRFCRSFNFELQAAANDNGIVLALGPQHSFPLESLFGMVPSRQLRTTLEQAILAVPMFLTRWRWNATRSLVVLRRSGGKKIPPPLQRFRADDVLSAVFPQQTACLENHSGDIEIPDHPLVRQTVDDCLYEAMDIDACRDVLERLERGEIAIVGIDSREPSPFSHELLNANPYTFLDNAPLEERRARAVATRRTLDVEALRELAKLDPEAIAAVRSEVRPTVRDAEELHEVLLLLGVLPAGEAGAWAEWTDDLIRAGRASVVAVNADARFLVAAETWPNLREVYSGAECSPAIELPPELASSSADASHVRTSLVRARLEICGPQTAEELAEALALERKFVERALVALEGEGTVLRGQYSEAAIARGETEWCDRRLLQRIHRLTLDHLRRQIEPVSREVFWRFLISHQMASSEQMALGSGGLLAVIELLEGCEVPATAWEELVLPTRVVEYEGGILDQLLLGGAVQWGRLRPPRPTERPAQQATKSAPIGIVQRENVGWILPREARDTRALGGEADAVLALLEKRGALFEQEIARATGLLAEQVRRALAELVASGRASSDGFGVIRSLAGPAARRGRRAPSRAGDSDAITLAAAATGGRWSAFPGFEIEDHPERVERWAELLLRRYGVVCRDLLEREPNAPRWHELVRVYRRLETRGDIRGGRFVTGLAGEQYADSHAVDRLRKLRRDAAGDEWIVVSGVDPLNLTGILDDGPRTPAIVGAQILLHGGRVVATLYGGRVEVREPGDASSPSGWMATALELGPHARGYLEVLGAGKNSSA